MSRPISVAFLLLSIGALAGCHPANKYYPPALPAEAAATITGSKLTTPGPFDADTRAYIDAIDGKRTYELPNSWDEKITLAPGPHEVRFTVESRALLAFYTAKGSGIARLVAESGKSYVLRVTPPVEVSSNCTTTTAWLESDDGAVVSDKLSLMIAAFFESEMPAGGAIVSVSQHTICPTPP